MVSLVDFNLLKGEEMRRIILWAAPVLVLLVPLLGVSLSEAAGEDLPEIYLAPECHECVSLVEVDLASSIYARSGKPYKVVSSQLIFKDGHGDVLFSITDPYRLDGKAEVGMSSSGVIAVDLSEKLAQLQVDSFTAVLRVNELSSNVVSFNVRAEPRDFRYSEGPGCSGSLSIEPIIDIHGEPLPNAFMAYFRNMTGDSVDVAGSTMSSRLLVNRQEYGLSLYMWAGNSDLRAGASWGRVVQLPSYVNKERKEVEAGQHEIQYKFAGCLSNAIRVRSER